MTKHLLQYLGGMTFVADPKKPVGGHVLVCESSSTAFTLYQI